MVPEKPKGKIVKTALFAGALGLFMVAEAAAGSLFYAGADVGFTELGSSDDTGYGIHVGTGIIPFIGVEAGYWDLGTFGRADYTNFYIAAKPSLDLGPVHLFVKGGMGMYDIDSSVGTSDDGVDLMYGLGAEWFVTGMFSLGANYTSFGFDDDDVDTFSLSLTFHLL